MPAFRRRLALLYNLPDHLVGDCGFKRHPFNRAVNLHGNGLLPHVFLRAWHKALGATRMEYPIGLASSVKPCQITGHLSPSGIVGVFKSVWSHSWGPCTEYICMRTVAVVL